MSRNFGIQMLALLAVAVIGGRVSAALLPYTTGLQLWLEADQGVTTSGGSVIGWADQSGNVGNDVTGSGSTAPTFSATGLNGRPTIQFDGVNDLLDNTTSNLVASGSARTVFVVGQSNEDDSVAQHLVGGAVFTFRRNGVIMTLSQLDYDPSPPNWYVYSDGVTVNETTVHEVAAVTNPFFVTYESAGTGSLVDEWLNGTSVTVSGGAVTSETGLTGFTVGNREDNTAIAGWRGSISEVIVFDSVLSDSNRALVENYLDEKYLPEPASASVLILSGLALLGRRRRV